MAARIMKSVDERVALLDQKIAKKQAEILRVYHPRNTMKIHGIA